MPPIETPPRRAEPAAAYLPTDEARTVARKAHLLVDAGEAQRALELTDALLAGNPGLGPAHAARARALRKLGRPAESLEAWQAAVQAGPRNAHFRLGLGGALAAAGRLPEGRASLEQAAALAPGDASLCRAASMFLLQAADFATAARFLGVIAENARADVAMRDEARVALAIIDEGRRIEPALRDALANRDPARLARALAATPSHLLRPDEALLDRLSTMARHVPSAGWAERPRWDARRIEGLRWPIVQAHFEEHLGDSVTHVLDSIDRVDRLRSPSAPPPGTAGVASTDHAADPRIRALVACARAVRERHTLSWSEFDPVAWESRVRYFHALMNAHQPAAWPGRFKPLPNKVMANRSEPRSNPAEIVGTVRALPDRVLRTASNPLVRAALCIYAFAKLHAFADGNGGIGRFLASRELLAAGLGPLIVPDELREEVNAGIRRIHESDDPEGLIVALAKALDWRDAFIDAMAAEARTRA